MIKIIVAIAKNNVIGNGTGLPWHLPEDLAYFKRTTLGHTVIMGRKTFESIGKPLPDRKNVVITSNPEYRPDGVKVYHSLKEAIAKNKTAFIIGGRKIYKEALPFADKIYITEIDAEYEGNVKFPRYGKRDWELKSAKKLGTFTTAKVYRKR